MFRILILTYFVTILPFCKSEIPNLINAALSDGSTLVTEYTGVYKAGSAYRLFRHTETTYNNTAVEVVTNNEDDTALYKISQPADLESKYISCISLNSEYLKCSTINYIGNMTCSSNSDTSSKHLFTVGKSVNLTCSFDYACYYKPSISFTYAQAANTPQTSTWPQYSDSLMTSSLSFTAPHDDAIHRIQAKSAFTSERVLDFKTTKSVDSILRYMVTDAPVVMSLSTRSPLVDSIELFIEYQEEPSIVSIDYQATMHVGEEITVQTKGIPAPVIKWTNLESTKDHPVAKLVIYQSYLEKSKYKFRVTVCNMMLYDEVTKDMCSSKDIEFTVLPATTTTTTTTTTTLAPSSAGSRTTTRDVPSSTNLGLILGLIFGILAALILIGVVTWFCMRRYQNKSAEKQSIDNYNNSDKINSNIEKVYPLSNSMNYSAQTDSPSPYATDDRSATLKAVTGVDDHLHTIDDVPRSRRPLKVFEPDMNDGMQ